jgi:arylsulfatase
MIGAAQIVAERFLATFEDFPPGQKAPSFSIDQAVERLQDSLASH